MNIIRNVYQQELEGGGHAAAPATGEAPRIEGGTIANPTPVAAPAPAPVAAPAPAAPVTTATAAPVADPVVKADWPEDWKSKFADGDEALMKRFGRYASPKEVAKALLAAQSKLSSGELKPVLGKEPTPEELADYRKEHGIPETADKYEFKDIKIDPVDKPVVDQILKAAHSGNLRPDQVAPIVALLPGIKRQAEETRAAQDHKAQETSEEALRAEWGVDYRRHMNVIHGLLDSSADTILKDQFLGGRLADGTPIGSSPGALKMLLGLALVKNPTGVVVPSANGDPMKGVVEAKAEIEKVMRTDRKRYNADEKMQARYRELLSAEEALKPRS